MGNMGFGWWGPGFGGVFMLLWWGLVIFAIVALARWLLSSSAAAEPQRKTPLEILQERFARGELDSEAYQRARRELD